MGGRLSSSEVAVWLRFQIAAGRLTGRSEMTDLAHLAERLGVTEETMADAFALLSEPDASGADGTTDLARENYRLVADLVDQIASISTRPA